MSPEVRLSNAGLEPAKPSSALPAAKITPQEEPPVDILVAGALAVDISCDFSPLPTSPDKLHPAPQTSNPARITQTLGGVAHNIAKAAHLLGPSVRLCSAIGDDLSGRAAVAQLENEGMRTDGITTLPSPAKTAQYVAVNDANKDLAIAMADMSILESSTPQSIQDSWLTSPTLASAPPKCVIADANWSPSCLHAWLRYGKSINALTIFEPVSTAKSTRLFTAASSEDPTPIFPNHIVDLATPNSHETLALHNAAAELGLFESKEWFRVIDALGIPPTGLRVPLSVTTSSALVDQGIPQQAIKLLPFIPTLLTKLGPQGVLLTKILRSDDPALSSADESQYVLARNNNGDSELGIGGLYVRRFEVEEVLGEGEVVSVNGIGDTFLGALSVGLLSGKDMKSAIAIAQKAAGLSLRSQESVSPELATLKDVVKM